MNLSISICHPSDSFHPLKKIQNRRKESIICSSQSKKDVNFMPQYSRFELHWPVDSLHTDIHISNIFLVVDVLVVRLAALVTTKYSSSTVQKLPERSKQPQKPRNKITYSPPKIQRITHPSQAHEAMATNEWTILTMADLLTWSVGWE